MKVFLADNSKIILNRLTDMLSDLPGIELVGEANKTSEALHLISKMKPDAVIFDIKMPGGRGIDVLEDIKKFNSDTVVIMLSNHPYPQYRNKCMEAGADHFFSKSTEFEKLIKLIEDMSLD